MYYNARAWLTKIAGGDRGKLSGKTLAIKDNIHVASVPMSCGSNFLRGFVSSYNATVVSRILNAGLTRAVIHALAHCYKFDSLTAVYCLTVTSCCVTVGY